MALKLDSHCGISLRPVSIATSSCNTIRIIRFASIDILLNTLDTNIEKGDKVALTCGRESIDVFRIS